MMGSVIKRKKVFLIRAWNVENVYDENAVYTKKILIIQNEHIPGEGIFNLYVT